MFYLSFKLAESESREMEQPLDSRIFSNLWHLTSFLKIYSMLEFWVRLLWNRSRDFTLCKN